MNCCRPPASSPTLVNFSFTFLVLIIFIYASGLSLTVHALWVPVILLTQLIFTLGITLFLSAVTVFYRDVLMILEIGALAWMFLTPVFYPFEVYNESSAILGVAFSPGPRDALAQSDGLDHRQLSHGAVGDAGKRRAGFHGTLSFYYERW